MSVYDIAITVAATERSRIEAVATAVSKSGLRVERVIPAIGAIYGRGDEACMAALEAVDGVERVRVAGAVQLAPFDPAVPQ